MSPRVLRGTRAAQDFPIFLWRGKYAAPIFVSGLVGRRLDLPALKWIAYFALAALVAAAAFGALGTGPA